MSPQDKLEETEEMKHQNPPDKNYKIFFYLSINVPHQEYEWRIRTFDLKKMSVSITTILTLIVHIN